MLNDDLISRAAAIAELMQMVKVHGGLLHYTGIKAMLEVQPAVDAVPVVHGHWVPDTWHGNDVMSGGSMATCSECGRGWLDTRRMRFCPCCGARMGGGEKPEPQEADGWISVKDRLPEERENWITGDWQHVICCCDFGGNPRRIDVRTYGFCNGHFWHGPEIMDGFITHWMPLPEPPEADERGEGE